MKELIVELRNDDSATIKLLKRAKENDDCLHSHALGKQFYTDKQQRKGYLGWTLPAKCELTEEDYQTIERVGDKVYIGKKKVDISRCSGYPFPRNTDEIKPDIYYIEELTKMAQGHLSCFKEFNDYLALNYPTEE